MMKICLITMLLMIALHPVCFAGEEFFIEDKTLKPVSDSITQVILSYEKDPIWKPCKFTGKPIDLDGDGKAEDFAVTTLCNCESENTLCSIWVLRRAGSSYTVVLSDGGYSMNILKHRYHGLADISIEASTADRLQQSSWQFDGKRYVMILKSSKPKVPSDAEINTWWKPENRERPNEGLQVNGCKYVSLVGGEEAFLASVIFPDRGRNFFSGSLLIRRRLKEAREIKEIGEDFEIIGSLNGASLISTKTVGSGQGTTAGHKTLLKLDGWTPVILHTRPFGDNLGECGLSLNGRRCHSEDTHWIFIDLNEDGMMDLVEVSVTKDGPEANQLAWRTETRVFLLKEGKYVVVPLSTIRTGKTKTK